MSKMGTFRCRKCSSNNVRRHELGFFCENCETINVKVEFPDGKFDFSTPPSSGSGVEDPSTEYDKLLIFKKDDSSYYKKLLELEKAKLRTLEAIKNELVNIRKVLDKKL
jgi:hypothetical protein